MLLARRGRIGLGAVEQDGDGLGAPLVDPARSGGGQPDDLRGVGGPGDGGERFGYVGVAGAALGDCRHPPLGLHTAADIHYGRAQAVPAARAGVLTAACTAHPERFVRQPPAPPPLPAASWINPPGQKETGTQ